jgi:hypothetical protein
MKRWKVNYECVEDSTFYGQKGDKQAIAGFEAETEDQALDVAMYYAPNNWIAVSAEEMKEH